jgi:DNA-binding IclR family transcriptional regulator
MSDRSDRQYVEAFARGLAVLEALSRSDGPLTNGELAAAAGLAPSTISRLTHTAMALGYVRRSAPSRGYELTPKSLTLGYPVLVGMPVLVEARRHLGTLAARTGETAALAVRDGFHVTFVEVAPGASAGAITLATGGRLPMSASAAGAALLAVLDPDKRRLLVARLRADLRARGKDPGAFAGRVAGVRADEAAVLFDGWRKGIGGIARGLVLDGIPCALTIALATRGRTVASVRDAFGPALADAAARLAGGGAEDARRNGPRGE